MSTSIVEAFGEKGKARDLDEVLRLEYRSKLLNPKWAQVTRNGQSFNAKAPARIGMCMLCLRAWDKLPNPKESAGVCAAHLHCQACRGLCMTGCHAVGRSNLL